LLTVLACPACYAGLGPVIGSANESLTLGWEASAATVTAGQVFATESEQTLAKRAKPGDYAFKRRFYLLWEPRLGGLADETESGGFGFWGGGASVGMRWDRVAGAERTQFGALGGVFFGGGYAFPNPHEGCGTIVHPYGSLAIGFRGSEFYVAPKFGVLGVPAICLDGWGGNGGGW
jgi:hypothetical protein